MQALKELLYKMADDQLIIGHRNSEWTGLGPILEEDIAFSSMAQDKIGQAQALYKLLHTMGEQEPDVLGFMRNAEQMHCCHLVEVPISNYAFSLMRNFLHSHAELIRFEMLTGSICQPLANIAKKYRGEIKYHVMHGSTWLKQLGNANEDSNQKMQQALAGCWNLALGIFEPSPYETDLQKENIFEGETALKDRWLETISPIIGKASLKLPPHNEWTPAFGGRTGNHTLHLQPMLDEMTEVYKIDPSAEW